MRVNKVISQLGLVMDEYNVEVQNVETGKTHIGESVINLDNTVNINFYEDDIIGSYDRTVYSVFFLDVCVYYGKSLTEALDTAIDYFKIHGESSKEEL